jgi:hypothetical protein
VGTRDRIFSVDHARKPETYSSRVRAKRRELAPDDKSSLVWGIHIRMAFRTSMDNARKLEPGSSRIAASLQELASNNKANRICAYAMEAAFRVGDGLYVGSSFGWLFHSCLWSIAIRVR